MIRVGHKEGASGTAGKVLFLDSFKVFVLEKLTVLHACLEWFPVAVLL